jgi:uncharacterized protein
MPLFHRVAKKVFFGRFQKKWRWPDGVPVGEWERVRFRSGNGATLSGLFGEARGSSAAGAVVLAHPMGAAAKGFWLKHGHAAFLRDNGFHVLAFDFNGFGESESTNFDFPSDVVAAGDYLRHRLPGVPLSILGSSFGAGYALCAMAREGHPFHAAVLEGTFPSLPFYWRSYRFPYAVLRVSQVIYPRFERELRPILAATRLKGSPRVLLIHGHADTVSPLHVGTELRDAMAGRATVEVWDVPGADHTRALAAQPDHYRDRVTRFLRP